jgi:hypothetical protein
MLEDALAGVARKEQAVCAAKNRNSAGARSCASSMIT